MGKHYTDPLAFILDGEAESDTDGRCTDLEPSRALQRAWGEWGEAVTKALLDWGHAHSKSDEIVQLIEASDPAGKVDIPYDVYMTLDGAGVGMDDGRWDKYLEDSSIKSLKKFLKGERVYPFEGVVGHFHEIQSAIRDEAYEQCKDMRGTRIEDDDLNGVQKRSRGVPTPRWIRR